MKLFIKGIIIGLGKILPGISGSILAIRLNVYEDIITSLNTIFKNFKTNIIFLTKIGLGILLSIILGSKLISHLLNSYYNITVYIFSLLLLTGIPVILREVKNYVLVIITVIIYILIMYLPSINVSTNYYLIGFIEAFTTIIPGISGTALLMSFGIYDEYLDIFSNIYKFEFYKLIPFTLGLTIGGIIIVRFIDYCFKKYRDKTYSVILGLLIGSIFIMVIKK